MGTCNGRRKGSVTKTKSYVNRQEDYQDGYEIEFRREGGRFWIYVNARPNDPFNRNVAANHLYDCCGQVCVTAGKEPQTFEMAEAIAHYWMQGYSEYVRTGEFPDTGGRVNVAGH